MVRFKGLTDSVHFVMAKGGSMSHYSLKASGKPALPAFIYRMIESKQADMKKLTLAVLLIALVPPLIAASAYAQEADTSDALHYNLGLGVMSGPKYPGASDTKVKALPVVGATYGRFFAGAADGDSSVPFGVGYNFIQEKNWRAGVAVGYDFYSPRKESDDSAKLHGLGDIDRTGHLTAFTRYSLRNGLSLSGSATVSGQGQGLQVKAGADYTYVLTPKLSIKAGPSVTWANGKSNQTFYGITAEQSASSGKSQYTPSSGFSDYTLSVSGRYALSPAWSIGARAGISYLPSTVNDSPIVDEKTTTSVAVFTAYRF